MSKIIDHALRDLSAEALAALDRAKALFGTDAKVAEKLGLSSSALSQAKAGKYRGDVASIEQRIRGVFMKVTVCCPVLGELSTKDCLDEQRRPVAFTNPLRVRLARACKTCPNRRMSAPNPATEAHEREDESC